MNHLAAKPTRLRSGFSLTELLVALVLGLFLVGGSIALFVTNKAVYTGTARNTELQDNARFAQEYLLRDLRHAYFFGEKHYDSFTPDLDPRTPNNSDLNGNCTGAAAVYSFNQRSNPPSFPVIGAAAVSGAAIGCIDDAARVVGIPSDVLTLKMVHPRPLRQISDLLPGSVYIASNRTEGVLRLYFAGTAMPSLAAGCTGRNETCLPNGAYWRYLFRAYYIRDAAPLDDEPPSLSRKILSWDTTAGLHITTEDLVEGVEAMRILYGTTNGNEPPVFQQAAAVTDWDAVVAIRVHLLIRTVEPDHTHRDTNSYTLGDTTVTATSGTALSQRGQLRNFHRRVVMTSVMLRNKPIVD